MDRSRDYKLRVTSCLVGEDFLFLVTGGEAHIGAISCAYWNGPVICVKSTVLPGHREGELSRQLAEWAASTLRRNAAVLMGIHIENAVSDDISRIINEVNLLMEKELAKLLEEANGEHDDRLRGCEARGE